MRGPSRIDGRSGRNGLRPFRPFRPLSPILNFKSITIKVDADEDNFLFDFEDKPQASYTVDLSNVNTLNQIETIEELVNQVIRKPKEYLIPTKPTASYSRDQILKRHKEVMSDCDWDKARVLEGQEGEMIIRVFRIIT